MRDDRRAARRERFVAAGVLEVLVRVEQRDGPCRPAERGRPPSRAVCGRRHRCPRAPGLRLAKRDDVAAAAGRAPTAIVSSPVIAASARTATDGHGRDRSAHAIPRSTLDRSSISPRIPIVARAVADTPSVATGLPGPCRAASGAGWRAASARAARRAGRRFSLPLPPPTRMSAADSCCAVAVAHVRAVQEDRVVEQRAVAVVDAAIFFTNAAKRSTCHVWIFTSFSSRPSRWRGARRDGRSRARRCGCRSGSCPRPP